jgi:phosphatidylglycerol:prolipoprotein diacylglycerol transferase
MSIYGLIIGIAVVLGIEVIRRKTNLKEIYLLIPLIFALLGARALYLLHNIEEILAGQVKIFNVWDGGLALFGALIGILLGIYIISKLVKQPFLKLSDKFFTYIPLIQAFGRIGNYFNKELYGKPTSLPWAIEIPQENRLQGYENYTTFHPTFLYESILNLILFALLIYLSKKVKADGILLSLYFIGYSLIRLLLNRVRIDGEYLLGIETSDLLSVIFLIIGIVLISVKYRRN